AVATSAAGTMTVNCVEVCVVGTSGAKLLRVTVEPATKFVPLMVRVNEPDPAATLVGLMEETVGTGLPAPPENARWKLVVPPSPSTEEIMKRYFVPEVAAKETCDCAIPAAALTLQAICVKLPLVPVTTVRIVP